MCDQKLPGSQIRIWEFYSGVTPRRRKAWGYGEDGTMALVLLGPPRTANDWNYKVALMDQVKRQRGGVESYTVQWVVRTLLHAQLVSCGATLDISEA